MVVVPLLTKTRQLLSERSVSLTKIARESGLGYEWLRKFNDDLIPDPSVNKVQTLHDALVRLASPAEQAGA